jgi:serine/threonine protein kinase
MNDPTSNSTESHIEVAFLAALDAEAGREEQVLARFCGQHAELAPRFREIVATQRLLTVAVKPREGDGEPPPERLGDFRIKRKLPSGGMGDLYEAVQEPLGRRVIVKTIRGDIRQLSDQARGRFLREQRILARLHHTHIVPIHAAGFSAPLHYYAMSYIEGAPLSAVVKSLSDSDPAPPSSETPSLGDLVTVLPKAGGAHKPNAPPRPIRLSLRYLRSVAKVMADAADAVHAAHESGILHRDIKPSNLMVDRAEHCWVIDFGLGGYVDGHPPKGEDGMPAGVEPETTPTGVLGTAQYMTPEQFRIRSGDQIDRRSDVYGLGATLYELLTLTRAFDGPCDRPGPERRTLRVLPRTLGRLHQLRLPPTRHGRGQLRHRRQWQPDRPG